MTDDAHILRTERECQDCGLFQTMPALVPGEVACCRRCNATLRHGRRDSLTRALACAIGALLLFIVALQMPFLDVYAVGHSYKANLFTGPKMLEQRGMWEISVVVIITLVVMPVMQFFLLISVLLGLRLKHPPAILPRLFGYVERIRPWSMIEVFLLGVFVAYTRLQAIALAGVMLCLVAADVALDHEAVWDQLESRGLLKLRAPPETGKRIGCDTCKLVLYAPSGWPCPRCGQRLRQRKRQSVLRAWSLLFAATVLYLPANFFPILTVIRFGRGQPSTIIEGVIELVQAQMWPLAALVFLASITVPLLKLVSLTAMLITTHSGTIYKLRGRTRLYRFIESIGRWSMIDVFMITVLVALVHMGFIATVLPGPGAICFASVVVLTMFATASFDPRLMWDAAHAEGHDVEEQAYAPAEPSLHDGEQPA
jgi:paraquat-inducible protein A